MKIDRWVLLGYVAAIFNPIPTGLVAAYVYYKDKKYRNTGKVIALVSVFLILLELTLALYFPNGLFP